MKTPLHILVSRLRFMGDIIMTTPLLHALRMMYPEAIITYLAEEPYISLLRNHPDVHRLLPLKRNDKWQQTRLLGTILTQRIDIAIDLFGNPRSAILTLLTGAKTRIGGNYRGRKYCYTHRIEDEGMQLSAINYHMRYLQPLGNVPTPIEPYLVLSPREKEWANKYLEFKGYDTDKKLIGIHPGATWPAKRWFPERFAELANMLAAEKNVQIVFTMGPGEEELLKQVISLCKFEVIQPEILSIRKLMALLHNLNVFVTNDCGPMHIAPAMGTPTVGIFGPGEPGIWFPYSPANGHRLVYHSLDCSRCHLDHCEKLDCMHAISVREVFNVVCDTINSRDIFR